MRTAFGRTKGVFSFQCSVGGVFLALLLQIPGLLAQEGAVPGPTAPAEAGKALPGGAAPPPASTNGGETAPVAIDYLYNKKPQDGSAAQQVAQAGQVMRDKSIADDALGAWRIPDKQQRARFERYLGMAEVPPQEISAYARDIAAVQGLLRQRKTMDAWRELQALSEYAEIDAGISQELANRIESIWSADRETTRIAQSNDQLKRDARASAHNADMLSQSVREKEIAFVRRTGSSRRQPPPTANQPTGGAPQLAPPDAGGGMGAPSTDAVMGKVQLTEEYLRTLEAKARIKMNELKSEKLFDQAKTDFADYISTLYESGRHLHVILAADFWRRIFDQGNYPVAMAQQVNAALEMTQEIQNALKVCATQLEEANVAAATERLKEAFILNERDPAVLGFPRVGKRKVEAFSKSLDQMQNVIEARDFTNLESLIENMKTVAPDFDATKPRAVVNAVKLQSKLRLGRAKLAAQQGDLKLALEEFQAAAEAWPGNPDLESNATTFFEGQDSRTQALQEFDRLVTENNYRQIFEKQVALAPALKDDTKRQEEFKAALDKIKAAEMAIEKANLLRANGDIFGAWESVELASADLPNDTKLNAMRGELSGKGSEFVAAINKAKDAEAKQQLGYSLTWYAIAQQHYPASQMANQAIERLSGQILSSSL